MEMSGMFGGVYRISLWISRFAYLNLIWILFTLLGLGVFGFMPATIAIFSVTRQWIRGNTDLPIYKTFLSYYKREFIRANLLGLILVLPAASIYLYFTLTQSSEMWMVITRGLLLVVTILYSIMLLYIFQAYVHTNLKLIMYLRTALMMGLAYPHYTLLMIISIFFLQFVFVNVPGLAIFFAMSITSYFLMWIGNRIFVNAQNAESEVKVST
ncbi:YesL family protein [Alteribacter populi]|uniref:YesL family protein n=1 Tax=Alteribacter populi TaxID=2011011 RepID=UPI000BBB652F|nr:YesL family protein [Alteribacter populi]